jgi:TPR repeat protein
MYTIGQGIPEDKVQAYMWLDLCAAQDVIEAKASKKKAKTSKKILSKEMSRSQIKEAKKLAREWKKKFKERSK